MPSVDPTSTPSTKPSSDPTNTPSAKPSSDTFYLYSVYQSLLNNSIIFIGTSHITSVILWCFRR
jgi:hypothetical protein